MMYVASMGVQAVKAERPNVTQAKALVVMQTQGAAVVTAEGDVVQPHVAPPALAKPRELWTPEEYAECEAWASMTASYAQRDQAIKKGDGVTAMMFVKVAAESFKTYERARRNRIQAEIETGRLRPMGDWQQAKAVVLKVVSLLASMDGELAQAANPEDPSTAMRGIADWKNRRWNPAIQAALAELKLPQAA